MDAVNIHTQSVKSVAWPRPYRRELILNLHGVGETHCDVDAAERIYWLDIATFDQLLDQVSDRRQSNPDPKIVITFDDGNASDALVAFPRLTERGLDAISFVCAGRIGKKHYLDRFMLKDLLDGGIVIGSHGMDHRDWRTLDARGLDIEIGDARRKLEDITQRPVTRVSIPFGSYDRRVLRRLMRDPWDCIYTSDRGLARPTAKIKPREAIKNTMDDHLISTLCATSPYYRLRPLYSLYKRWR